MGTLPPLPPLGMPKSGAFSSLFPPILDVQTRDVITNRGAAQRAGTAPPALVVPDLASPVPGFVLRDIDGDGDQAGRILGALRDFQAPKEGEEDVDNTGEKFAHESQQLQYPAEEEETYASENVDDIWAQAAEYEPEAGPSNKAFQLRNWESPVMPSPCRLDAPPAAFDALQIQSDPPIELPKLWTPAAVPPSDVATFLDHLVRTTMVSRPPGLRWSRSKAKFAYDSRRVDKSAAGFIDEILAIATAMRRVEIVVEENSPSFTPTHHALKHGLGHVLEYMKQRLTDMEGTLAQEATPWLVRSRALDDVALLGPALCEVICWPLSTAKSLGFPARPSSMLTHVYHQLQHHLHADSSLHVILCHAYLLQQATVPWLALLHQWIGVADSSHADEDVRPTAQPWADLGITRTPLPPVNGEPRWEYTFVPRRMPIFIPPHVRRTFFEAGRSLRALREASGGVHPLCWTDWPIRASWGWGAQDSEPEYDPRFHARRVQREIDKWRASTMARQPRSRAVSISSIRSRRWDVSVPVSPYPHSPPHSPLLPQVGIEMWEAAARPVHPAPLVDLSTDANTAALWTPTPDDLAAFLERHSDPSDPLFPHGTTLDDYIAHRVLAAPLAHATLISRALVSHYLDDLCFLDHLDVLHAFWLGGDAGFTERVGAALFRSDYGEDVGMGRRARTRARLGIDGAPRDSLPRAGDTGSNLGSNPQTPTPSVLETPSIAASTDSAPPDEQGVGLGVGLSDRKRWPPGGTELTYALRTTLLDHDCELFSSRGPVWAGIEDRVSFALRDLPDDARLRERWMDPQGIEALDFLYLAYSPPAGIAPLLPTSIMDKYETVYNLLLRLARVDVVLRGLYFDILRPGAEAAAGQAKTGVDAHHSRPVSRINQPTVHAPLLGVFPPDSDTARTLRYLRFVMSVFVSAFSRYVLDATVHNTQIMHTRLGSIHRSSIAISREPSRPPTPAWMILEDDALELDMSDGGSEAPGADDSQAQLEAISQLQSAHSLVLYHHIILNRILRAALLSPGGATGFAALTALLSLVLDFGKAVKDIKRGALSAAAGAEMMRDMRKRWEEGYATFIKAVERLARTRERADSEEDADDSGDEHDLQLLLGEGSRRTDLRELLLRLRLGRVGGGHGVDAEKEKRKETPRTDEEGGGAESAEARPVTPDSRHGGHGKYAAPRTPPAEVELAEDLAVVPDPVVHATTRERPAPRTPLKFPLFQLRPGSVPGSPASPAPGSPGRHRSDDEISLD